MPTCCWAWPGKTVESAPQGSRRAGREHRAGRAAAATGDRPGPGPVRPLQRPHRRREAADQHGPGRRTGRRAVRGRPAVRHRRQARPQRRDLGPGHRPLAGLHRRRHSRAAGASGQDRDRRRADDHRPRERPPPHDRALRHQRPRPGRFRGRGPAALCRGDRDRRSPAGLPRRMAGDVREPGPGADALPGPHSASRSA